MTSYIIKLETDNTDITEIEACLIEMINNHLNCTDAIYSIEEIKE